nr:MAG TPA: hypothetical protein [Caudoviricetes sp.]
MKRTSDILEVRVVNTLLWYYQIIYEHKAHHIVVCLSLLYEVI